MTIHAYQETYLSKAQAALGDAFDYAINTCGIPGEDFIKLFTASSVSKRMENGEPAFLAGKSGIEIAADVIFETTGRQLEAMPEEHIGRSREYWIGWAVCYYQWFSARSFSDIFTVLSFDDLRKMYYTLHEADITKFADIADARIAYDQCLFILDNQQGAGPQPLPDVLEGSPVSAIAGALNPRIFCDETIYGLCAYGYNGDAARGKALVRELYVYLLRGCNSHKAARELFLHRNTLVYHIELLEKLMGVKLDELSTSQTLYLVTSCLIALAEKR